MLSSNSRRLTTDVSELIPDLLMKQTTTERACADDDVTVTTMVTTTTRRKNGELCVSGLIEHDVKISELTHCREEEDN